MKQLKVKVLTYSRVSGYFNPTENWNKGKQSEFSDRKYLNIEEVKECCSTKSLE